MKHPKLLAIATALASALIAVPSFADPNKDESGKGRGKGKEEFWEGNCKVERKWKGHGEYKEERKCRGTPHVYAQPGAEPEPQTGPVVVISLPPIRLPGM